MRVFVAGATGVIGRRVVPRLVAAGHQVTAIARDPVKAAAVRAAGAQPVGVSLFDRAALAAAVAGHDAVVNLATKIPPVTEATKPAAWAENERIRTEGSRNLADAAIAAGAQVYVQESLAFLYGDHGDAWLDASRTPLADSPFTNAVRTAEASVERFATAGGRGIALRFGMFLASDSSHAEILFGAARRGLAFDAGEATGYLPTIDVDDAAAAVVAALGAPSGTYDIVDAEPLTRAEIDDTVASLVGRRSLRRAPGPLRRRMAAKAAPLSHSQRVSNARFTAATGWHPTSAGARDVLAKIAAEMRVEPSLRKGARSLLWQIAAVGAVIGVWAQVFPRSFYDSFPFGRGWVAMDGPYNEHLVRDVGSFNLALVAATLVALAAASRPAARAAAVGWLVYAVPHGVYHSFHLEHMDAVDAVAVAVSVWVVPVLAVMTLRALRPRGRAAVTPSTAAAPGAAQPGASPDEPALARSAP